MDPNGAFRRNLENANYDLRKWRRVVEPQGWDFAALDVGGGLGWDLGVPPGVQAEFFAEGQARVQHRAVAPVFFWTP